MNRLDLILQKFEDTQLTLVKKYDKEFEAIYKQTKIKLEDLFNTQKVDTAMIEERKPVTIGEIARHLVAGKRVLVEGGVYDSLYVLSNVNGALLLRHKVKGKWEFTGPSREVQSSGPFGAELSKVYLLKDPDIGNYRCSNEVFFKS